MSADAGPPTAERQRHELARSLVGLLNTFVVVAREGLQPFSVTLAQTRTLSSLFARDPQTVTELARGENISQPGMTQLINGLERRGLVTRVPSTFERRTTDVFLTEAGRLVMVKVRAARIDMVEWGLDRLTARRVDDLLEAVPALQRLADELSDSPDALVRAAHHAREDLDHPQRER